MPNAKAVPPPVIYLQRSPTEPLWISWSEDRIQPSDVAYVPHDATPEPTPSTDEGPSGTDLDAFVAWREEHDAGPLDILDWCWERWRKREPTPESLRGIVNPEGQPDLSIVLPRLASEYRERDPWLAGILARCDRLLYVQAQALIDALEATDGGTHG